MKKKITFQCILNRRLPLSNIGSLLKKHLSKDIKISNEAKEFISECIYEFILFIVSESQEKCQNEKRRTLDGDDLLDSLKNLGFEDYHQILLSYSDKYKIYQKSINEEINKNLN